MRPRRLKNEINVVPYIDVMLVLLVIFMVATPMMTTGSVDLPTTGNAPLPDKVLRVIVQADGGLAIKGQQGREREIGRQELAAALADEGARNPDTAVLVAGDKNARYEAVLNVLDEIKRLDVKRVGLETTRR